MNGVLTSAPVRRPRQHRPLPRQPSPLPGWLQTAVLLFFISNCLHRPSVYDAHGNLLSVTEPGQTAANVAYTYDALNRLMSETSQGKTHDYIYDLAGNRRGVLYGLTISTSGGTTTIDTSTARTIIPTYDALNRLNAMTEYDGDGNNYVLNGAVPTGHFPNGRVTHYFYDLSGNTTYKQMPNGDLETSAFDALNRATDETTVTATGSLLCENDYGYDADGNVTSVAEQYPSGLGNRTVTNTYDADNRLQVEAVTGTANTTTTYTYDAANNCTLTEAVGGADAGAIGYGYNNLNQMVSIGSGTRTETLAYDDNGNCTSDVVAGSSDAGTDAYTYDFENKLIGMNKGTAGAGTGAYAYGYDYRTRRILRDESGAGGATTAIVFSGGTSVQEYDNGSTTPTVEYLRANDYGGGVGGVLYSLRSGTPSYTYANKRGDIVAKTDGSGNLTFQGQYNASGKVIATTGSTLDRQKSNSKDTDPWGGINDGQRISVIRGKVRVFLTRDPAGFVDGPNLYTYVIQNPWTAFDPEGLYDNFVTQAEQGAYNLTHQSLGETATALGIPQMAAQAATGASRLAHGDTQAMGASLQQTGAGIKQTAADDAHLAGVGAQRLASGNVSAMDLADAGGRAAMTGIMVMSPVKGVGAVSTETKVAEAIDVNAAKAATVPEQSAKATTGLGPNDPAQRYQGPWTQRDLDRAKEGKGPIDMVPTTDSKGRDLPLELHHGDQMPGAGIHEVSPAEHDNPALHPNESNQGVTDKMRKEDRQLHWQMRGQEQGNPPPPKQT